jgi:hypothetical protein
MEPPLRFTYRSDGTPSGKITKYGRYFFKWGKLTALTGDMKGSFDEVYKDDHWKRRRDARRDKRIHEYVGFYVMEKFRYNQDLVDPEFWANSAKEVMLAIKKRIEEGKRIDDSYLGLIDRATALINICGSGWAKLEDLKEGEDASEIYVTVGKQLDNMKPARRLTSGNAKENERFE